MIGLNFVYPIAGLVFAAFALLGALDRRWPNAAFHALIATSFLLGDRLGDAGNGLLVLAIVAVAGSGRMRRAEAAVPSAVSSAGWKVFAPALLVPVTALLGTLLFKQVPGLVDAKQATLVALTCGVLLALALGYALFRPPPATPFRAGRSLADEIGWAAILPQMLASLGAVFALAGVGKVVGDLLASAIPAGSVLGAVAVYGIGMALFTMVMGNAFAAFPVMVAGIGVPLLVQAHGADPARVAALGMLLGFSGTLLTPMAANFNLVPAALLDLRDRYGVIRAQAPTALAVFAFNLVLLYLVVR